MSYMHYTLPVQSSSWGDWYFAHADKLAPAATGIGAVATIFVGVIAAWIALARHRAQTNADIQRRIIESYSKAVGELANEKLEARLGAVYTLERISKESKADYWTVMETLTAFVRERSKRNYAEFEKSDERISPQAYALWEERGKPEGKDDELWAEVVQFGEPPAADIEAALKVIKRRSMRSRKREERKQWCLDFHDAVLKQATLGGAHLERAELTGAHLDRADLWGVHLEGAMLGSAHLFETLLIAAHLEKAGLYSAHLERAELTAAHLKEATLIRAHLEGAHLERADLEGADLEGAHLEGADLERADLETARGLTQKQLNGAYGEAVKLPPGYKIRAKKDDPPLDLPEPEGFPHGYIPPGN